MAASSPGAVAEAKTEEGARGLMGRDGIAKRLADLAFKMAADNLCSSESVLDRQERPVHVAFFDNKLPLSTNFLQGQEVLFYEDDINHHFCTVHQKIIIYKRGAWYAPRRRNIAMPRNISDLRAR